MQAPALRSDAGHIAASHHPTDGGAPGLARWGLSIFLALAAHGALALALLALRQQPPPPEPITIPLELAAAAQAPLIAAPESAATPAIPMPATAPAPPEPAMRRAPAERTEMHVPEMKAEAPPPSSPPRPQPVPRVKPEVLKVEATEAQVARVETKPAGNATSTPTQEVLAVPPATEGASTEVASAIPAPAPVASAAPALSPDALARYQSQLALHLERSKRYPRDAQLRRQQGIVHLQFAMNNQGHVLSAKVVRGSRYALLDEEVLAMLQRAEPLPVPPPGLFDGPMEFTIPVQFNLK